MNRKAKSTAGAAMLVAVAALGTSVAGCRGNGASTDRNDFGTDVIDERDAIPDLEGERLSAEAALVPPSQFPDGWSREQSDTDLSSLDVTAVQQAIDACAGATTSSEADSEFDSDFDSEVEPGFARTLVYGDVYRNGDGAWIEQVLVVDSIFNIDGIEAKFAAADASGCFAEQFRTALQTEFDGPTSSIDATVGEVTVDTIPVDEVGEASFAYQVAAAVESSEDDRFVYLDLRFTRVGDTINILAARSDGEAAIDPAVLDQLTEFAEKRLPVAVN